VTAAAPAAVSDPPWFADDPVAPDPRGTPDAPDPRGAALPFLRRGVTTLARG
jgi:hypothetical protein